MKDVFRQYKQRLGFYFLVTVVDYVMSVDKIPFYALAQDRIFFMPSFI